MKNCIFFALILFCNIRALLGDKREAFPPSYLDALSHHTECVNYDDFLKRLNFEDYEKQNPFGPYDSFNPGPAGGYNTNLDQVKSCYVEFLSDEPTSVDEKFKYRLRSMTKYEALLANTSGLVYLTHDSECSICSTLDQLAVYLNNTDLTNPVRSCGFYSFLDLLSPGLGKQKNLECLADLGFVDACQYIWYYNILNTRRLCTLSCLLNIQSPYNEPVKGPLQINYCEPYEENPQRESCKNTINERPACDDFQYENGEYRLNPCLQCDECRSGPVFKKYAGRTRRNSGLESGILRPPSEIVDISHFYGALFNYYAKEF